MATGNAGYTDVQVRTLSRDLLSITRNSSVIHYGLLRSIDQSLKICRSRRVDSFFLEERLGRLPADRRSWRGQHLSRTESWGEVRGGTLGAQCSMRSRSRFSPRQGSGGRGAVGHYTSPVPLVQIPPSQPSFSCRDRKTLEMSRNTHVTSPLCSRTANVPPLR
jgi:hypothetical protein